MEDCTIEIKTHTGGTLSVYRAKGTFHRTERGVEVRYLHEEEEVFLLLQGEGSSMERESLLMRFQRGEETAATLRLGAHEGSLPLRTRYYALEERDDGFMAVMRYELGVPARKFSVNIRICPCSEER